LNEPDDCKNSFPACSPNPFTTDVKKVALASQLETSAIQA
jgi:hypothetical protein